MARVQAAPTDLAGEVTGQLLGIGYALRQRVDAEVARLGLTPAAARALSELDPDRPSPARDLAVQLDCERSNVTGLVDRLEEAGLVERRVDPEDRRIKTLVVTESGRRMQVRLHRILTGCGAILDDLDEAELRCLRDALAKVAIPQ
jgi:DNA-binding MarR family transcriptional regulator